MTIRDSEDQVLDALRRYNRALENKEVEGQVAFFADEYRWQGESSKAALRESLLEQSKKGQLEIKRFELDEATVSIAEDGVTAVVDGVPLRSPSGNGTFAFQMIKNQTGQWQCLSLGLSASIDKSAELVRSHRERLLKDPHRPGYHFSIPEGIAMPFDPNGAIYWKGRYHLFYIFQDSHSGEKADHWGHVSSADLLHWRFHPTGLIDGMYSGNCFLNREGVPTVCYHQKGIGNSLAVACDDELNAWDKLESNPITPQTESGDEHHGKYRSWDPFGWYENDTYYAIFGGGKPAIAKSKELQGPWEYVGDLFAHGVEGVSIDEDVSCPELFQLGDKSVVLCISHRLGCRYYIGEWRDEQFYPETHAQMSWVDNTFFAPESLVDDRGRRIMWAWLMDEPEFGVRKQNGWSGVLSMPRVISLDADGSMKIEVPDEFKSLRYDAIESQNFEIKADQCVPVDGVDGRMIELELEVLPKDAKRIGVCLGSSPNCEEKTEIYYDSDKRILGVDFRKSGPDGTPKGIEEAPFDLGAEESLRLRIFVDQSVVEVFANDRQAITRRIYPSRSDSVHCCLFSEGGDSLVSSLSSWRIHPTNPY